MCKERRRVGLRESKRHASCRVASQRRACFSFSLYPHQNDTRSTHSSRTASAAAACTTTGRWPAACRRACSPSRLPPPPAASTTRQSRRACRRSSWIRISRAEEGTWRSRCRWGWRRTADRGLWARRGSFGPTVRVIRCACASPSDMRFATRAPLGLNRPALPCGGFGFCWLTMGHAQCLSSHTSRFFLSFAPISPMFSTNRRELRDDPLAGLDGGGDGGAVEGLRGLRKCASLRIIDPITSNHNKSFDIYTIN